MEPLVDTVPVGRSAVPAEWASWAEEPGRAVRIGEGGEVLGEVHAVIVGRAEAWFEGLWVQPGARGRGLGRRLIAEAEGLVRRYGADTVRAAVPARDDDALAVAERTGFVRSCEAAVLVAQIPHRPLDVPPEVPVAPAGPGETGAMVALLQASPQIRAWRGLAPLGWRFRRVVPELVRGLIRDRRVLRAGDPAEGIAWRAVRGSTVVISVLSGPPAHRRALFGTVVEGARRAGATHVALFGSDPRAADDLRIPFAAHPWCPDGLVIVEKHLTTG
ncbi:MAG: GNAT family N-acetyltransferase [Armatimonadota bacterium]|nr:GNAT family N-acetyltransferase [Armatimonadota bacterium]MDR7549770.1 GNAT family N-acetyltransferase [Armatimonadota bacterium]